MLRCIESADRRNPDRIDPADSNIAAADTRGILCDDSHSRDCIGFAERQRRVRL